MFKNKIIILLMFACFMTSSNLCFASKPAIATLDLRALVLLHPLMSEYSPINQAFKTDKPLSKSIIKESEHKTKLAELRKTSSELHATLVKQHKDYESETSLIFNSYTEKIAQDPATASVALQTNIYNAKRLELEKRHKSKLRITGERLAKINKELNQLERVAQQSGFSDPQKTKEIFRDIIKEIRDVSAQIANEKGISIVLNSSHKRLFLEQFDSTNKRKPVSSLMSYEKILKASYTPPDSSEEVEDEGNLIIGYYQNLSLMAAEWLSYEQSILAPFEGDLANLEIIHGGTDITIAVLQAIFNKYQVNQYIGEAIIKGTLK